MNLSKKNNRKHLQIDEKKQLCVEISIKNLEDLELDISDGE